MEFKFKGLTLYIYKASIVTTSFIIFGHRLEKLVPDSILATGLGSESIRNHSLSKDLRIVDESVG